MGSQLTRLLTYANSIAWQAYNPGAWILCVHFLELADERVDDLPKLPAC